VVDVHWSDISFLVGFNDGPVDEGPRQIGTFSSEGDPVSVLDGAFGTNSISMLFDGDGDGIIVGSPATAGCDFGTGDFTVELWLKNEDPSWTSYFHSAIGNFDSSDPGSWSLFVKPSGDGGHLVWVVDGLAVSDRVEGTSNLTGVTSFSHVAVTRSGSTLRVYANGVMEGKHTGYTFDVAGTGDVKIGANNAGDQDRWKGRIDEVRVTKGVARYTTDTSFSPPTAPFYRAPMMQAYPGFIQVEGQHAPMVRNAVTVQDPYWNNVSFLIGYDTGEVDEGPYGITLTATGDPVRSAVSAVGEASGVYNQRSYSGLDDWAITDQAMKGIWPFRWYWEIECQSGGPTQFDSFNGVVGLNQLNDPDTTYDSDIPPNRYGSLSYSGFGRIKGNDNVIYSTSAPTYGAGDILMFAFEPASGKLWLGVNGTWQSDPDSDAPDVISQEASGDFYPALQADDPGEGGTLRSLTSQFSYTLPTSCRALGDRHEPSTRQWVVGTECWVEIGSLTTAVTVADVDAWVEVAVSAPAPMAVMDMELWIEKDTT